MASLKSKQTKPKKEPLVGIEELRSYPWLTLQPGESFLIPVVGLTVYDVRMFRDAMWFLHCVRVATRTTAAGVYVTRLN